MKLKYSLLLTVTTFLTAGLASAHGSDANSPPGFLATIEGITHHGSIGGMELWNDPATGEIYMVTADGKTIVKGSVYTSSGIDVGKAYAAMQSEAAAGKDAKAPEAPPGAFTGPRPELAPVPVPPRVSAAEAATGNMAAFARDQATCMTNARDLRALLDAPILPPTAPADKAAEVSGSAVQPATAPLPSAVPAASGDMTVAGMTNAEIASTAHDALGVFEDTEKQVILINLITRLQGAKSEEQFLRGLTDWRIEINQRRIDAGHPPYFSEDGHSVVKAESVTNNDSAAGITPDKAEVVAVASSPAEQGAAQTQPETSAPPAAIPDGSPIQTVAPQDAAAPEPKVAASPGDQADALLKKVRHEAFWFGLGKADAPTVYAFIDPTCPYSAQAIAGLSKHIDERNIELRVMLVPAVSERAPDMITAILQAENPLLAFFDHEIEFAKFGRSSLDPKPWAGLAQHFRTGVVQNYDLLHEFKIPGVPFFVYETAQGAQAISGDPSQIPVADLLVDSFKGQ